MKNKRKEIDKKKILLAGFDIEESEKEFEAGKCLPWEDVMSEIKGRYHLYAY